VLAGGLFLLIAAFVIRVSLKSLDLQTLLAGTNNWFKDKEWVDNVATWVSLGVPGIVISLWLRFKLIAIPANPAKLLSRLTQRASLRDLREKLSLRFRFGTEFSEVCQALRTRSSPGLVILIDDLDRCRPADVLVIMEAVNYFVSVGACFVVLGMDRRQVEHCVGLGFKEVVEGLPEDELIYSAGDTDDEIGKRRAYARHYLEKMINVEVPIPDMSVDQAEAILVKEKDQQVKLAPWVAGLKSIWATSYQIARVAVLAIAVGLLSVWGLANFTAAPLDKKYENIEKRTDDSGQSVLKDEKSGENLFLAEKPGQEKQTGSQPKIQPEGTAGEKTAIKLVEPNSLKDPWRWAWWGSVTLALAVVIFWGIEAVVRKNRLIVRDSPAFKKALKILHPLVHASNPTPRAVKRYQNRMRYLAMRLRTPEHETGALDWFLNWLGHKVDKELVPQSWFTPMQGSKIEEPTLLLMGAIEIFAPRALQNPSQQFFKQLNKELESTTNMMDNDHRKKVWKEISSKFKENFKNEWPNPDDIRIYQSFVRHAKIA
jgi:hypothetical protein